MQPTLRLRVATLIPLAALLAAAFYAAGEGITGADLWWHLAAGRYIVEHGEIPRGDVLSYTHAGEPWFNPEWLSQALFFTLFRLTGGTGLALFKVLVAAALFPLAAWIGWRRSGSAPFAIAAAVAAAFLCRPYLDIRPQLFAFAGTLVVVAIVDAYRRGARDRVLVALPVVMALWVNLHSSFIYGVAVLLLFAGGEVVKALFRLPDAPLPMRRALRLAAAALLAGAACLANPAHVHAFTFPFEILGPEHAAWRVGIIEWVPPVLFQEQGFNPAFFGWFLVAVVLLALAAAVSAPRRFDLADAAQVAFTAALALRARRFVPLFALVSVPFLARNLALVFRRGPDLARARDAALLGALGLAVIAYFAVGSAADVRRTRAVGLFDGLISAGYFPRGAVEFLRMNPLPARLFHVYTWGGYLAYQLPERKVFIDGRAHGVYPGTFYDEYRIGELGDPRWSDLFDRWQVDLVMWPTGFAAGRYVTLLQALRRSPQWQCVYDDNSSAVFAHRERARDWIEAYRSFRLVYPDVARAQLFLANAYLEANEFARARDQIQDIWRRYPGSEAVARQAEDRLVAETQATGAPVAWFGVGFYRDLRGDVLGAAEAYRTALARGLTNPHAAYAYEALARLKARPKTSWVAGRTRA